MASEDLTQFGDRELRLCRGTIPAGEWAIPVFVVFFRGLKREFAKVAPAVGLTADQAQYLAYHLRAHNEWRREDLFLIERKHLSKLTERVNGVTPAYYFKWPGVDIPVSPMKLKVSGEDIHPDIPEDAEDFLEFVHKKRFIDRNVLRLAWTAVAREAATWMLKKKRPINLGFVRLYAVPYRANWKEILLAKFPSAHWWFARSREFEDEVRIELTTLEMMAIHQGDRLVRWSVEAIPTEDMENDMVEMEAAKKATGETQYVHTYEKTVFDLFPTIMEVFRSWLKKVSMPFPEIRPGSWEGSKKLVPYSGCRKSLPTLGRNIPVRIVVDKDPPRLGSRRESAAMVVRPKAFSLPKVPDLLPPDNAVHGTHGDMDNTNGHEGANGLPVPSTGQGEPVECELLALRPNEGAKPVANGTERKRDIEI